MIKFIYYNNIFLSSVMAVPSRCLLQCGGLQDIMAVNMTLILYGF